MRYNWHASRAAYHYRRLMFWESYLQSSIRHSWPLWETWRACTWVNHHFNKGSKHRNEMHKLS